MHTRHRWADGTCRICGTPRQRIYSRGTPYERALLHIEKRVDGCWMWTGSVNTKGYAHMKISGKVWAVVHRVMYEYAKGPVPAGLQLDHLCRNKPCVNPDHLEAVTARENMHRGMAPSIRAHLSGICKRGHQLSEGYRRKTDGGMSCRECRRIRRASGAA